MKVVGSNPQAKVEGLEELAGKVNYFIGNDPDKWHTDVATCAKVMYSGVYPGIDLVYYGNQSQLEYDFIVQPGAKPDSIRLAFEGAQSIRINESGELVLNTPGGEVIQRKPIVYQESAAGRNAVEGAYVLSAGDEVTFQVSVYDQSRALVIDPVLSYSTYLGGIGSDQGYGIAVDSSGAAYVTGVTDSINFPTASPIQAANGGGQDAFVTKINPAGNALVYSTYLGGSSGIFNENGSAIAVDSSGAAYVTGQTSSANFPTVGPIQVAFGGGGDAFVTKINPAGNGLVYSTYLGGSNFDEGRGIAVDSSGAAYVTGQTQSTNFPTASPIPAAIGGGQDAFVTKINPAGNALVYSTYLGGSFGDVGNGIAVDSSGAAYVTGLTVSTNFPTASPIQGVFGGGPPGGVLDAFVTKINAAGNALVYSTYLGGSSPDQANAIAVDSSGAAYVTGYTQSTNFPTANPLPTQAAFGGGVDAFVTKFNPAGTALVYSTYLGGGGEQGAGIAADSSGAAYVTGYTYSLNFPTANPIQAAKGGGYDAFVAKIEPINLVITGLFPSPSIAGVSGTFTVTAKDDLGNTINNFSATATFSSSDANALLQANYTFQPADNGTKTFSATFKTAGTHALTVTDTLREGRKGTQSGIQINPAAFAKLQLLVPGEISVPGTASGKSGTPAITGSTQPFNVRVNAVDAFWNFVNTVADTVAITSTDPVAVLPANATLVAGTNTFSFTLNSGPSRTLTASDVTDPAKAADTSPAITVNAGAFVKLLVLVPGESSAPGTANGKSGVPVAQVAGIPFNVTVLAVDGFWNINITITETVRITSSDATAVLPANAQLVSGSNTFSVTLGSGPAQTVTASDIFDPAKTASTSSSITVTSSTITGITPDAAALNGAAFTLTVNGTGFLQNSTVRWNGSARPTTAVSATQLSAAIPASDLLLAGRVNVTIFPGTAALNTATFFVYSGTVGTWIVTDTNDAGQGSLRFAMDNCRIGDNINFDPLVFDLTNADAATVINVVSALPVLDDGDVTIDASARRVTVNGISAGAASGLDIVSNGNRILGLSLINFTQSGVRIRNGAKNNNIGGSRLLGGGPNGQGLRISKCGAFGVEFSGVGTDSNVVKGCWIGLDASGSVSEANLAGVLIQAAAKNNFVGSTSIGEGNVISGNAFEGVTISGAGTDGNMVRGNRIGTAASTLAGARDISGAANRETFAPQAIANGSSGVFLSRGTTGSSIGADVGDAPDDVVDKANAIGFNGGSGVEIRALNSRDNSARGNAISQNLRGGIALFDGSNGGITKPTITRIARLAIAGREAEAPAGPTLHAAGRASIREQVAVEGTSERDGTIELFNDSGDQGATFLASSRSTNGRFAVVLEIATDENVTATLTDDSGNTSPFDIFPRLVPKTGTAAPQLISAPVLSPLPGRAGEGMTFSAAATDADGDPISYLWAFGDGLTAVGQSVSHTYVTPGSYLVLLTLTDGTQTSSIVLQITITAAAAPGAEIDSDGDGVSDKMELLANTDPNNPADAPPDGGTVTADKVNVALKFSSTGSDSIKTTYHLPTTGALTGAAISVRLGEVSGAFTALSDKGKSGTGNATLKYKQKTSTLQWTLKKQDLRERLGANDLQNETTPQAGKIVEVPIGVAIVKADGSKLAMDGSVSVLYKAKAGKTGKAKQN